MFKVKPQTKYLIFVKIVDSSVCRQSVLDLLSGIEKAFPEVKAVAFTQSFEPTTMEEFVLYAESIANKLVKLIEDFKKAKGDIPK